MHTIDGKILVIADTHLTRRFNQKKFDVLSRLIRSADRVIINGDFYESHATSFENFVTSLWHQLFPLLKEKRTICITGNHDTDLVHHDYKIFCDTVAEKFTFAQHGTVFHVMHGHSKNFFTTKILPHIPDFVIATISALAKLGCILTGPKYLRIYKSQNTRLKAWKAKHLPDQEWLICGHTHFAELDNEARFANPGLFLTERIASYLIIEKGEVSLHRLF